jgi:hypothetical protein
MICKKLDVPNLHFSIIFFADPVIRWTAKIARQYKASENSGHFGNFKNVTFLCPNLILNAYLALRMLKVTFSEQASDHALIWLIWIWNRQEKFGDSCLYVLTWKRSVVRIDSKYRQQQKRRTQRVSIKLIWVLRGWGTTDHPWLFEYIKA